MGGGAYAPRGYGRSPVFAAAQLQGVQFSGAELFLGGYFFRQQAQDLRQVCGLDHLTAYIDWI